MARIVSVYERIQWQPRPDVQGQTWLGEIDGRQRMLVCRTPNFDVATGSQFVGMLDNTARLYGPSPRWVMTQMRSLATALLLGGETQKAA